MFRIPSPGDNISVVLRRLLQRSRRGSQGIYKLATEGRQSEHQRLLLDKETRYQVKDFSVLCMGKCKPPSSLNSFLSYAPQLSGAKSYFLIVYILNSLFTCSGWLLFASFQLLRSHHGVWQLLLGRRNCVPFLEPLFTVGGPESQIAMTFLAHHI